MEDNITEQNPGSESSTTKSSLTITSQALGGSKAGSGATDLPTITGRKPLPKALLPRDQRRPTSAYQPVIGSSLAFLGSGLGGSKYPENSRNSALRRSSISTTTLYPLRSGTGSASRLELRNNDTGEGSDNEGEASSKRASIPNISSYRRGSLQVSDLLATSRRPLVVEESIYPMLRGAFSKDKEEIEERELARLRVVTKRQLPERPHSANIDDTTLHENEEEDDLSEVLRHIPAIIRSPRLLGLTRALANQEASDIASKMQKIRETSNSQTSSAGPIRAMSSSNEDANSNPDEESQTESTAIDSNKKDDKVTETQVQSLNDSSTSLKSSPISKESPKNSSSPESRGWYEPIPSTPRRTMSPRLLPPTPSSTPVHSTNSPYSKYFENFMPSDSTREPPVISVKGGEFSVDFKISGNEPDSKVSNIVDITGDGLEMGAYNNIKQNDRDDSQAEGDSISSPPPGLPNLPPPLPPSESPVLPNLSPPPLPSAVIEEVEKDAFEKSGIPTNSIPENEVQNERDIFRPTLAETGRQKNVDTELDVSEKELELETRLADPDHNSITRLADTDAGSDAGVESVEGIQYSSGDEGRAKGMIDSSSEGRGSMCGSPAMKNMGKVSSPETDLSKQSWSQDDLAESPVDFQQKIKEGVDSNDDTVLDSDRETTVVGEKDFGKRQDGCGEDRIDEINNKIESFTKRIKDSKDDDCKTYEGLSKLEENINAESVSNLPDNKQTGDSTVTAANDDVIIAEDFAEDFAESRDVSNVCVPAAEDIILTTHERERPDGSDDNTNQLIDENKHGGLRVLSNTELPDYTKKEETFSGEIEIEVVSSEGEDPEDGNNVSNLTPSGLESLEIASGIRQPGCGKEIAAVSIPTLEEADEEPDIDALRIENMKDGTVEFERNKPDVTNEQEQAKTRSANPGEEISEKSSHLSDDSNKNNMSPKSFKDSERLPNSFTSEKINNDGPAESTNQTSKDSTKITHIAKTHEKHQEMPSSFTEANTTSKSLPSSEVSLGSDTLQAESSTKTESGTDGVSTVEIQKGSLGLGFCIEGGLGSAQGDRPISVKRIFSGHAGVEAVLKPGDVILSANGKDLSKSSQYEAWNYLKHYQRKCNNRNKKRLREFQRKPLTIILHIACIRNGTRKQAFVHTRERNSW